MTLVSALVLMVFPIWVTWEEFGVSAYRVWAGVVLLLLAVTVELVFLGWPWSMSGGILAKAVSARYRVLAGMYHAHPMIKMQSVRGACAVKGCMNYWKAPKPNSAPEDEISVQGTRKVRKRKSQLSQVLGISLGSVTAVCLSLLCLLVG